MYSFQNFYWDILTENKKVNVKLVGVQLAMLQHKVATQKHKVCLMNFYVDIYIYIYIYIYAYIYTYNYIYNNMPIYIYICIHIQI